MSFILNYLDEALDTVTRRYEGDDEENDLGSSDDDGEALTIPVDGEPQAETEDLTGEILEPNVSVRSGFSAPSGASRGVGNRGETEYAAESHNWTDPRIGSRSVPRVVPQTPHELQQQAQHRIGQRHQHQQQQLEGSGQSKAVRPVLLDNDQSPFSSDRSGLLGHPVAERSISSIDDRDRNVPSGGVRTPIVDSFHGNNRLQRAEAQASIGEGLGDSVTRMSPGGLTLRKSMMKSMVAETLDRRHVDESHQSLKEGVAPVERINADITTERQGMALEEKQDSQTVSPVTQKLQSEKDDRLQHLERERLRKKVEEDRRTRVLALEAKAAEELRRRKRELEEERRRELEKKKEDEEMQKGEEERERQRLRQLEEEQRERDLRCLTDDTNAAATAVTTTTTAIEASEQEDGKNARELENGCLLAADRSRHQGQSTGDSAAAAVMTSTSLVEEGRVLKRAGDEERNRTAARDRWKSTTTNSVVVPVRADEGPIKQEEAGDGPIRKDNSSLVPQSFRAESLTSLTVDDEARAREEAWAEARVLAEGRARTRALLAAQSRRAGASNDPGEKAPPASVVDSDSETERSRRGSVTLDQSDAAQPTAMQTRGGRGWAGFFSDRRQQDERTAPFSASSSVTSSQVSVSTFGDRYHPPTAAAPHDGMGGPAPINSRSTGPHDFERIRGTRKRRGSSSGRPNGSNPPKPDHECAACLGMWNEGGSALNRWYRCRRCGATVHSACRQFFDVGEACVESGGQGREVGNPPGWRSAVNCAGVVQVGALQAFGLPIKPGDSVYVALRLLPWKERVKTGSAKWGDLGASWPSQPSARHDLLHLYNSEASPVPTLRVEVWRSALRVLDDLVGYATINMAPLLARPTSTSERWHGLSSSEEGTKLQEGQLKAMSHSPAASAGTILLSLGFFPTGGTPNLRPLSVHSPPSTNTRNARQPPLDSVSPSSVAGGDTGRQNLGFPKSNTPVVPETLNLDDTAAAEGAQSLARPEMKVSTTPSRLDSPGCPIVREMGGDIGDENLRSNREGTLSEVGEEGDAEGGQGGGVPEGTGGVHLFRIKSYSFPVWCQVCGGLLLGVRNQGFRCEACGMDVHQGCQLRANFARSCPSRSNKKQKQNTGRGAGSNENVVPATDPPAAPATIAPTAMATIMADSSERRSNLDVEQGVGIIKVHLRSAHRYGSGYQAGKHSYRYKSVSRDPDNTRVNNHADGTPLQLRHRHSLNSSSGDVDKGFLGAGGVLSPGRRRRRWSGTRDDSENSEGFFKGDHYCRLRVGRKGSSASAAQEVRTEAVFQTPEPVFNRSWTFVAPAYDSIVSIDLVDASNDRPVGRFETSVIALLQEDYDARSLRRTPPSKELGERRLLFPGSAPDEDNVTGLLQVRVEVEEDKEAFFGPKGILGPDGGSRPRRAPSRQNADLSVESLKALLGRLKGVLFWFKMASNGYKHVMSWDNPALTSISLVIFVYLAFVGDTEYLLAILPFSLFLFMTRGYFRRRSGRYVHDWLTFAAGTGNNTPSKPSKTDFRSVGMLKVAVVTGRGLVSWDLKLPGNAYVRVTFVPKSGSVKDINGNGGHDVAGEYLIGQTAPLYTGDSPEWGRVVGGVSAGGGWGTGGTLEYTGGTDALLQNVVEVWSRDRSVGTSQEDQSFDDDYEDMCLVYPLLQPLGRDKRVLPWNESTGFLRFSVVFANPFNRLMDKLQGQVVMPVASLVQKNKHKDDEKEGGMQPEVRGWFDVSLVEEDPDTSISPRPKGPPTNTTLTPNDNVSVNGNDLKSPETQGLDCPTPKLEAGDDVIEKTTEAFDGDDVISTNGGGDGVGSLFLRLQLTLPDKNAPVTVEDVEASRALQVLLGEDSGGDVVAGGGSSGASTGAVTAGVSSGGSGVGGANNNSGTSGSGSREGGVKEAGGGAPGTVARLIGMPMGVLSTARDVQDAVSEALDTLEAIKQLLNWTHPHKTSIVYGIIVLTWVVLMVVPGRYIILAVGLYEFSKAWLGVPEKSQETPPLATKLRNMLVSLPVDSELSACYAWESRAFAKQEKASQRLREQRAKLKLLGAGRQWEGNLRLRDRPGDPWESRYVVVLGHRMAWWGSSKGLDEGKKAKGQLLLQGHAGVTHLSPMEAREVTDPRRVLCIFGRSPDGLPHKVLFMADTVETTAALEDAILSVVETKRD